MSLSPAPAPQSIGDSHDELWRRGILTKSMVKTYLLCPLKTQQRFIEGRKSPPGFAACLGSVGDLALQVWGEERLAGRTITDKRIRELVREDWDRRIVDNGVEVPRKLRRDTVLDALAAGLREFVRGHDRLMKPWGELVAVQGSYGLGGDITLGGVPIAGHPDFTYQHGVVDLKVVSKRSRYFREPSYHMLEHVFHATLTGTAYAGYALVKWEPGNFQNRVDVKSMQITEQARATVAEIVRSVRAAIDAGVFPPTGAELVGQFPCSRQWCGYFGQCPVTKHLRTTP